MKAMKANTICPIRNANPPLVPGMQETSAPWMGIPIEEFCAGGTLMAHPCRPPSILLCCNLQSTKTHLMFPIVSPTPIRNPNAGSNAGRNWRITMIRLTSTFFIELRQYTSCVDPQAVLGIEVWAPPDWNITTTRNRLISVGNTNSRRNR